MSAAIQNIFEGMVICVQDLAYMLGISIVFIVKVALVIMWRSSWIKHKEIAKQKNLDLYY